MATDKKATHISEISSYVTDKDSLVYLSDDFVVMDHLRQAPKALNCKVYHNLVMACVSGRLMVDINSETIMINAHDIMVIPPGAVLNNYLISPDFECKMFGLSNDALQRIVRQDMDIWNNALYIKKVKKRSLQGHDEKLFGLYYDLIIEKLKDEKKDFKREIVHLLIEAIIYEVFTNLRTGDNEEYGKDNPYRKYRSSEKLFNDFLDLLGSIDVKKHPVRFYAGKLIVSPKYLATVCREQSGRAPLDWIQEYVQSDIRHYLCDTAMPIKEVSERLGFPNTSFFGKYIREHFGCTPLEMRNNAGK